MFYERGQLVGRIGQYLLSVVATSIIVSVSNTLVELKGLVGTILKLLTGLVLAIVIVSPWTDIRLDDLPYLYNEIQVDASTYVEDGQKIALSETSQYIKSHVQAYILDKANLFGLKPEIEMLIDGSPPAICEITITCSASPYAKQRMIQIMVDDLGVSEENIIWKLNH